MNDLHGLEQTIEERLDAVERAQRLAASHLRWRQEGKQQRQQQFRAVADRLVRQCIRPRLHRLTDHLPNAVALPAEEAGRFRCVYSLQPTRRFPATGRLELAVHPDLEVERLYLVFHFDLLPAPFPFEGHDHLVFRLDEVEEQRAAAWVEEKLLQVLDICLRLEAGEQADVLTLALHPAA